MRGRMRDWPKHTKIITNQTHVTTKISGRQSLIFYLVFCCIHIVFFFGAMCDVQKNISKTISKVSFVFVSKISKWMVSIFCFCVFFFFGGGVNNSCVFCISFVSNSFVLAMFYEQSIFVLVCALERDWSWQWTICL